MQRERKNASGLDHVYVLQGLGAPTAHRIRECDSLARPSDEGAAQRLVAAGNLSRIDMVLMQHLCKATELCCLSHPEARLTRPVRLAGWCGCQGTRTTRRSEATRRLTVRRRTCAMDCGPPPPSCRRAHPSTACTQLAPHLPLWCIIRCIFARLNSWQSWLQACIPAFCLLPSAGAGLPDASSAPCMTSCGAWRRGSQCVAARW